MNYTVSKNTSDTRITSQHIMETSPLLPAQPYNGGSYNTGYAFASSLQDSYSFPYSIPNPTSAYTNITSTAAHNLLTEQGMTAEALITQNDWLSKPSLNYQILAFDAHQIAFGTHTPIQLSPAPADNHGRHEWRNIFSVSPTHDTQEQRGSVQLSAVNKFCTCKKSRCLKLYCHCFGSSMLCGKSCACVNCSNNEITEDTANTVREQISSRYPEAFDSKLVELQDTNNRNHNLIATRHTKGCNCRKSKCDKKYCQCYQADVGCFEGCRCENCKNPFNPKPAIVCRRPVTIDADEHEELNDANYQNPVTALSELQYHQTAMTGPNQTQGLNELEMSSNYFHIPMKDEEFNSDNQAGLLSTACPDVPVS